MDVKKLICCQCGNVFEGLKPYCPYCRARVVCIFCGSKEVFKTIMTRHFAVPVCGCCRKELARYFIFHCLNCGITTVGKWETLKRNEQYLYERLRPLKTECEKSNTFGMINFGRCEACVYDNISPSSGVLFGLKDRLN